MSVPSAELTAPPLGAPSRTAAGARFRRLAGWRLYASLVVAALVVSALSLLIPSTPSYDPWSWLVWGREIVHLNLQTTAGPTWKPLPVIFTTLFAPFGRAAPDLWLVIARAGAIVAVAMVFRLCLRLTRPLSLEIDREGVVAQLAASWAPGVLAGSIACIGLIFTGGFITSTALGYSEGLLTALVLIAVERHLDGSPRQAFAVGFFAALDRPEIWLFWGPYGLWLFWKDPGARKLVIALFALIPVLWFLPEYWGSGHFFRGVSRAHTPRSNSPAFASCPFCTELGQHAWPKVPTRIKLIAIAAMAAAAYQLWQTNRSRDRLRLVGAREHSLAAIIGAGLLGFGWWIVIAVMTQAGFSGNDRYLVLGAALIEIAGGVGWGWGAIELARVAPRMGKSAASWLGRGRVLATCALLAVAFLFVPQWLGGLFHIRRTHRALNYQALLRTDVSAAINRVGGSSAVLKCGSVMTEGFQVPMLAYYLGVHTAQVQAAPLAPPPPPAPNVIFQVRAQHGAHMLPLLSTWPNAHYKLVTQTRTYRVLEQCAGKVSS